MSKKYLAQIIATDNEGLQMISACTTGAMAKVADMKYLETNKVFLLVNFIIHFQIFRLIFIPKLMA